MAEGNRRHSDAEVHLLQVFLGFEMDGGASVRRAVAFGPAIGLYGAEFALNKFQHAVVRDIAGGGDDQMIGRKPVLETRAKSFTIEFLYRFRRAQDGAAERMFRPEAAREKVVQQILGIVQVHLDFFENDLAFFSYVFGIEFWPEDKVGDYVKGDGQVLVEDFGVKTDLLFGREGIEHAADRIHFPGDVFGGAALRALEDHVLDEMGQAVFFRNFEA